MSEIHLTKRVALKSMVFDDKLILKNEIVYTSYANSGQYDSQHQKIWRGNKEYIGSFPSKYIINEGNFKIIAEF